MFPRNQLHSLRWYDQFFQQGLYEQLSSVFSYSMPLMWMYVWSCVCFMSVANMVTLLTRESSGLYTVQSELHYKVTKEDKDAHFSCEVSYFVPGAVRTSESKGINITVHCKSMNDWEFLMKWNVIYSNSCSCDKLNNTAWICVIYCIVLGPTSHKCIYVIFDLTGYDSIISHSIFTFIVEKNTLFEDDDTLFAKVKRVR